ERRRSPAREENVGLVGERAPQNALMTPESMPARERDHEVLRQQALADQCFARNGRPKNPDVDPPTLQRRDLLHRREVAQLDFHLRMAAGERPDDARPVQEVRPEIAGDEELTDLPAARPLPLPRRPPPLPHPPPRPP